MQPITCYLKTSNNFTARAASRTIVATCLFGTAASGARIATAPTYQPLTNPLPYRPRVSTHFSPITVINTFRSIRTSIGVFLSRLIRVIMFTTRGLLLVTVQSVAQLLEARKSAAPGGFQWANGRPVPPSGGDVTPYRRSTTFPSDAAQGHAGGSVGATGSTGNQGGSRAAGGPVSRCSCHSTSIPS